MQLAQRSNFETSCIRVSNPKSIMEHFQILIWERNSKKFQSLALIEQSTAPCSIRLFSDWFQTQKSKMYNITGSSGHSQWIYSMRFAAARMGLRYSCCSESTAKTFQFWVSAWKQKTRSCSATTGFTLTICVLARQHSKVRLHSKNSAFAEARIGFCHSRCGKDHTEDSLKQKTCVSLQRE